MSGKRSITIYGIGEDLMQRIEAAAAQQRRSVSNWLVGLLEDEFTPADQPGRVPFRQVDLEEAIGVARGESVPALRVANVECPVCRTVHDQPFCSAPRPVKKARAKK